MFFDRFDICEAYLAIEWDYNVNGMLQERPSNKRRNESTAVQLARIGFKNSANLRLSENGAEIYEMLIKRYNL